MGTLILLSAFPMFLFPKHLDVYYKIYKKPRIEAAIKEGSNKTNDKNKSAVSVIIDHLKGMSGLFCLSRLALAMHKMGFMHETKTNL